MKISRTVFRTACLSIAALAGLGVAGCQKGNSPTGANGLSTKNNVVWYIPSDVERLNPFLSSDEGANYIQGEIWEVLNGTYPRNQEPMPLLASLPEVSSDNLTYTYTMNPKANWSDGKPVTGEDVIFSYKIAMNPKLINSQAIRGYFVTCDSVYHPNGDPNKVSFHWSKFRYDIATIIGYVKIVPKHIFDVNNYTDKMPWSDLHNNATTNPAIQSFATAFEDQKISRDPKYLIGSGPYKFQDWITNDRVILQRDTNYWAKDQPWLDAYPDQIIFKTIKDPNAALTALKAKEIDIDPSLTAAQYLTQIDTVKDKFIRRDTVYENLYSYVGWNNANPMFSKNTRKALTMLINRDEIIHSILHDMTKKIDGPVAPTQPNYDPTVKEPAYDIEAGKKLLAADGWADTDGDGILDKKINGTVTPFKFTFLIASGSDVPKQICLVMANQLKKAGIEAGISQIESSVYLEDLKSHSFEAMLGGWVGNAGIEDEISQLWESSQSKNKGSNHYSYSNPEADALMEAIKVEPDKSKRMEMSHRLQHIIVEDQPVTFLYSSPDRIAWIDRFDNFEFFHSRPPFDPRYWIVRGSGVQRMPNGVPMSLHAVSDAPQH